jgi:very-short-patch-repair endonuclease
VHVHRSRTLRDEDVRIRHGLPVTSPARAILDAAGTALTDEDVREIVDEGVFVLRIVTRRELEDVLAHAGGHPGAPTMTRILSRRNRPQRTGSDPERRLLELIRAAGLPEPDTQVWIGDRRLDFLWRRQRVALEVDAYGTHGSRHRFEQDRRKDADLLARTGIATLRITRERIVHEPFAVVATLARAVAE